MGAGLSPEDGAESGEQLRKSKGLEEVIVRAGVEAAHPVLHFAARCKHEDGRGAAAISKAAADFPTIHHGERDIKQNGVVAVGNREGETFWTAVGLMGDMSFRLEGPTKDVTQFAFILDDEYSHATLFQSQMDPRSECKTEATAGMPARIDRIHRHDGFGATSGYASSDHNRRIDDRLQSTGAL